MLTLAFVVTFAAGGYAGYRYGRALEQNAVSKALSDLGAVNASVRAAASVLSTRLGYLKNVL